jgi:hypothetical protein
MTDKSYLQLHVRANFIAPSPNLKANFASLKADFQCSHEAPRSSLRVLASN